MMSLTLSADCHLVSGVTDYACNTALAHKYSKFHWRNYCGNCSPANLPNMPAISWQEH